MVLTTLGAFLVNPVPTGCAARWSNPWSSVDPAAELSHPE